MEYTLKVIEIGLKLLTDVKMILDYENGIWGGITKAISHYAEANNKYMHGCDKTKERSAFHIFILSINTDGPYQNYLFILDLNLLKIYKCLHMTLL